MKQSIRKRLSIIIISCSVVAVLLSALLVNITITNTFNKYMEKIQTQRNTRLVEYFQQVYKSDGGWNSTSGEEMMHEAYMSNYCLSLLDDNRKVVWEMNHEDIQNKNHMTVNGKEETGVYTSNTFDINVNGKTVGYIIVGQYSPVLLSQEDISFKGQINKSIVFSGVLTLIIVAAISLILSKQFSEPIKEVSKTSVSLSKGNYNSRSNIKSNIEEIRNLTESINDLGEKLNSQDLLRKRLISDISHEIRTPLNVLQNNLEAMIDGIIPVTADKLNSLNDEVIRFGKLLNNLNSLKQIESDEIVLKLGRVNIGGLISNVISDFNIAADEKNIKLIINKEEGKNFIVVGDYDKLKQVFINLISNAIKFNNINGTVWVNISSDINSVIIKIKDNGIGIKKEDLPYVFERMYRGDKSRHKIEGSGIGLTLVKKILTLHSGTIDVESKEDKETVFTVCINKSN
ncbi:sensor histidine kinase [Clostridium beijerinckii]|jgi:Signal transduction histidine kinase|uniref:histidine kinase n=2 Tax=Clostridium beijerinckii TaxID=1520 RepID=A0AAE2RTF7_CLOBE|nr:HAMP domain-containing sensor histidine kinase [Clostridium beijerinckii]ABR35123.1 integral membrane sensor signal transduction histidine kinase [Clostridium beijerinckii NCIMB 8052]AIU01869.1 integral membrane sensor signal transduction histidine kinase [Clostridium beijerinckii ATCC 35702]MBF7810244.1 HAMP domain-containing histidine kinase [Clostridium beijerinckii]NRT23487.1 signal transduction histidine kinase [Clostridium beijerinckii]NRT68940.1 signal transduction histidine kinase [